MPALVVLDFGLGNVGSVISMLRHIGVPALLSSTKSDIEKAAGIVISGVGAFDTGMQSLSASGLQPTLQQLVVEAKRPVLGICLGMQMLADSSEEGSLGGLGWIPGRVRRLVTSDSQPRLRVPNMGWASLDNVAAHPLLSALDPDARFYFVHSYYLDCSNTNHVIATASHVSPFAAVVANGNVMGTQFHPEKSHQSGMALLKAFAQLALE